MVECFNIEIKFCWFLKDAIDFWHLYHRISEGNKRNKNAQQKIIIMFFAKILLKPNSISYELASHIPFIDINCLYIAKPTRFFGSFFNAILLNEFKILLKKK